jgi:hypothetical protein
LFNILEVRDTNSFLHEIEAEKHCNEIWMKFEWNSIYIQLNSIPIQLKINGMPINGKCIQDCLMNIVLQKNKINTHIWKDNFLCLFTWEWAKQSSIWNCPIYLWNLKFSYLKSSLELWQIAMFVFQKIWAQMSWAISYILFEGWKLDVNLVTTLNKLWTFMYVLLWCKVTTT